LGMEIRNHANGRNASRPGCILLYFCAFLRAIAASAGEAPVPVAYYVEKALSGNPSLASMQERIRMKENSAVRAGALDDPKAWIGLTNVPADTWSFRDEDMTGKEIGISQMFPYPGKRRIRTDIALREREQAGYDLEEMRNMLRSDVRMTYAELATVRRQAEVVRHTRDVLGDIVGVTQEMYSVGRGSQPDVLRGQVESGRMREMLLMLTNRERVLSIRLNTLSALPPDRPVPDLEEPSELTLPLRMEELVAAYREDRPGRKALQARVVRGEVVVAMARREYYPDFEVSVSYMQRDPMPDGTKRPDMFTSMLLVNIPVWRKAKLDPAVREMTAEREMAVRELDALDLAASNEIGRILATLENRAAVAVLYRTTLIPQAEQSYRANVESYEVGKIDFPMLMDSLMTVLSFRKEYFGMVGEMHMEKARLEAAVGRELN